VTAMVDLVVVFVGVMVVAVLSAVAYRCMYPW
jgi:hypothetical protein